MSRRRLNMATNWLALGIATLLVLTAPVQAKEFVFEQQRVFAVGDDPALELSLFEGNVEVTSHPVDRIVVTIRKRVNAVGMDEARLLAENVVVKVDRERSVVSLNTSVLKRKSEDRSFWNRLFGGGDDDPYGAVDFEIMVPDRCRVKVTSNAGRVYIANVAGEVQVQSSAAEVELNTIEGPMTINNASGKTIGELLFGPVTVDQPMGEIVLNWVEGDVRVKSSSARISIKQETGAVDLKTVTGSVDIQTNLASARDMFVTTESGDIHMRIPELSSGKLEISSELGDIKTDMPIAIRTMSGKKLVGEFGDGGVTVYLTSSTGDVTVAQF